MKFLSHLAAGVITSTLIHGNALADQVSDFSVFKPAAGITANIYIENAAVMVHTSKVQARPLMHINQSYVHHYPNQLYRINDNNADGLIEISALRSVNLSTNQFCYSVFHFNAQAGSYRPAPSKIECQTAPAQIAKR